MTPINRLLVANRGEIACRIFETCRRLGIETVAVHSDADAHARHVREADHVVPIGGSRAQDSYLRRDLVMHAAQKAGADAIHPGYGFLSEDPDFAEQVQHSGRVWIGPGPKSMIAMSDKICARETAQGADVPVVPGSHAAVDDSITAQKVAEAIGYPVIVKASAGGGGLGMTTVHTPDALDQAIRSGAEMAGRFFRSRSVYLEKYIASARHVEVQVLGLPTGQVHVVGDRDCTVQRRHQKVLEEAPAPGLTLEERGKLHQMATAVAESVDYQGAGTIETIMDRDTREFYFLEMNTRLQVEHPVTELVTGVDLVQAQIEIATGKDPEPPRTPAGDGHALEFRVYAEDPEKFLPGPGKLDVWQEARGPGIRVDSGYQQGDTVTPFYDPLLAKLCAHGSDRADATTRLADAADDFTIEGVRNNLPLVHRILANNSFITNTHTTSLLMNGHV